MITLYHNSTRGPPSEHGEIETQITGINHQSHSQLHDKHSNCVKYK